MCMGVEVLGAQKNTSKHVLMFLYKKSTSKHALVFSPFSAHFIFLE